MKPEIGFMGQLDTKDILDDISFAVENGFDWFVKHCLLNIECLTNCKRPAESQSI